MKKWVFIFPALVFLSCFENPYALSDENSEKDYLIDYIENLKNEGRIGEKPLLVLNGEAITYDSLRKCELLLYRKDIDSIYAYFKSNDKGAQHIYGKDVSSGVILIQVKRHSMICD